MTQPSLLRPSIKHHQLILIDHHQVQPPQPRIDQNLPRQLINPLSSLQLLPIPLFVHHLDDRFLLVHGGSVL